MGVQSISVHTITIIIFNNKMLKIPLTQCHHTPTIHVKKAHEGSATNKETIVKYSPVVVVNYRKC